MAMDYFSKQNPPNDVVDWMLDYMKNNYGNRSGINEA